MASLNLEYTSDKSIEIRPWKKKNKESYLDLYHSEGKSNASLLQNNLRFISCFNTKLALFSLIQFNFPLDPIGQGLVI